MDDFKVSWRTILVSMFATMLFLSLFVGLTLAEKNTQKVGFEDYSQFITICNNSSQKQVSFNFLGKTINLDFSLCYAIANRISKFVYDFIRQTGYFSLSCISGIL